LLAPARQARFDVDTGLNRVFRVAEHQAGGPTIKQAGEEHFEFRSNCIERFAELPSHQVIQVSNDLAQAGVGFLEVLYLGNQKFIAFFYRMVFRFHLKIDGAHAAQQGALS